MIELFRSSVHFGNLLRKGNKEQISSSSLPSQILSVLAKMSQNPRNFGIEKEHLNAMAHLPREEIVSFSLFEENELKIKAFGFFLGQGASFEFHDHPNMHVFSLNILGDLKVEVLQPPKDQNLFPSLIQEAIRSHRLESRDKEERLTRLRNYQLDSVQRDTFSCPKDSPSPFVTKPDDWNYHRITAETPTVFIDICVPYYDFETNFISYYEFLPGLEENKGSMKWKETNLSDQEGKLLK